MNSVVSKGKMHLAAVVGVSLSMIKLWQAVRPLRTLIFFSLIVLTHLANLLSHIPPPNLEIRLCMSHHRILHCKSFPFSYRVVADVEYQRKSKKVGLHGRLSRFWWPAARPTPEQQ